MFDSICWISNCSSGAFSTFGELLIHCMPLSSAVVVCSKPLLQNLRCMPHSQEHPRCTCGHPLSLQQHEKQPYQFVGQELALLLPAFFQFVIFCWGSHQNVLELPRDYVACRTVASELSGPNFCNATVLSLVVYLHERALFGIDVGPGSRQGAGQSHLHKTYHS